MTREEFIKQRCEIDKITEEEFEEIYRVVECNCGKPYCKDFRCFDLDDLLKENQELKNQLEEHKNIYIKKVNNFLAENVEPDPEDLYMAELEQRAMDCELMEMQQKEFVKYLENEIENQKSEIFENSLTSEDINLYIMRVKLLKCEEILSKYKEIIGGKDEIK